MKNLILGLLIICISPTFCQTNVSMIDKKDIHTKIILGSTLMLSGIIMSQSNIHEGHRIGIPCFMLGVTLTAAGHDKRKKLRRGG